MKQLPIISNDKKEVWSFYDFTLFDLVKSGVKTATCYLSSGEECIDKFSILKSNTGEELNLETVAAFELLFDEVTEEMALLEGEGDLSLEYWRKAHFDFFNKELKQYGKSFTNDTKIIFEIFKVV
ncbi:MAG: ASCH domain-containing protein [Clostridia bacterium]|nr:ASCH domain-containing protein [Clostridia bacterium]